MQRTIVNEIEPTPAAGGTNVLASLITDTSRPLVQLAAWNQPQANLGVATHVVGVTYGNTTTWHEIGPLDLDIVSKERLLFAALSAYAMQHVRDAKVQIGDAVLVMGADAWSLLLLQWAKLQGASPLVYARRGPRGLDDLATAIGVDVTLSEPASSDFALAARRTHREAGFAVVLDGISNEQSMAQALGSLRDGGRYMLAGIEPQQQILLNAYPDLHRRDLDVVSANPPGDSQFADNFRFSLDLASTDRLRLDGLLDLNSRWRLL